jgi:cysteine desulfurase/selenocysteine lyase
MAELILNAKKVRRYFPAVRAGRVVTNNAASTQIPIQLLQLFKKLAPQYDNVHRGQSSASIYTTKMFENSYDTFAQFIGAESKRSIILYRNATEAINSVMYSLMSDFRDGDNLITTYMEHNSNYVPWYGLTHDILPKFGIHVECRLAKFDRDTGLLDIEHLRSLVDQRTKLICCTGASNFLGTKPPLHIVRQIANESGYIQPDGEMGSLFLIDGAQLVPHSHVNVRKLRPDFLVWSCHKMISPFGIGVLYGREKLLAKMRPFLYGGDMIAEGKVSPELVEYNELPWKYTAGTPNILGTIMSAQAIRLLVDFALLPKKRGYYLTDLPLSSSDIELAMYKIEKHEHMLINAFINEMQNVTDLHLYGPQSLRERTALFSFNHDSKSPMDIASCLNTLGVESRAGCHCATLAHHFYGLTPPASCRVSFFIYNDMSDIQRVIRALKKVCAES